MRKLRKNQQNKNGCFYSQESLKEVPEPAQEINISAKATLKRKMRDFQLSNGISFFLSMCEVLFYAGVVYGFGFVQYIFE